jgi:ParB-like chromosome segregation protein Spo0J
MKERYSIEWVNVQDIHEDRDNPNAMNEAEFSALISEIKLNGFLQPIVTRICKCEIISKEHRIILGGEHRWRAAQHPEIAMKEVPCIDVDLNDEDAKLLMVNLNRIHGNFIPLKLAGLLIDLNKKIPSEELQKRLYVSKEDLIHIIYPRAAESIKVNTTNPAIKESGTKQLKETQLFSIALTREQYDKVTETLEHVIAEQKCKKAEALVLICEKYHIVNNRNEKYVQNGE